MSAPPFHGSCLCKQVAFEVNATPAMVTRCHCQNCKKFTGTVFTTNVIFRNAENEIKFTKGEELVKTYRDGAQDSGNTIQRAFCGECGSPLFNAGAGVDFKIHAVFYSALDDFNVPPTEKAPDIEFYCKDRASWVHPIDGAVHFEAGVKSAQELEQKTQ